LDGFGFLQPQNERKKVLGVLFPSSLFKYRAPDDEHLISVFSNHATPVVELLDEIKPLIGIRGPHTSHHIKTWTRAIPQYIVGYRSILESIHALENRYPGLHFVGNYRNGVALGNCMDANLAPPHFSEHQPVI
jgi:oxygen-dependent protoporphyrinogen oxidase